MQMREKVGKSRNTLFFQWFGAPEGRKVGSLKRRVPSHLARWEMKNCTPLWREAHFEVKMYKTHHVRTFWKLRCRKSARRCGAKHISKSKCTKHIRSGPLLASFGSWDVEKVHAAVARNTFRSQNAQNTLGPDHFWQLRCRKSARRCGAKRISKSKCTKHSTFGPLLEVQMSKKCRPLWREAHFDVKMLKTPGFGPLLEVQMSKKCTQLWREAHFEVKMLKTPGFGPLLEVQMSLRVAGARDCAPCQKWEKHEDFVAFSNTTTATPHYTPIHYTTLQLQLQLHFTTFYYTTLHSTALQYTKLHYTTLHYTTLHSTTLHYTTLHYTPLHFTYTYNYTPLH